MLELYLNEIYLGQGTYGVAAAALNYFNKSMDELTTATKALDRVLRAERFWVPQWYKASSWVAYLDQYSYPANLPPYALGELDFWWSDAAKAGKLKAAGAIK